jgi:hypothetical protein
MGRNKKMRRISLVLVILGLAAFSSAQPKLDLAVGAGFMFLGEEEETFQLDSTFAALHWNGLSLPGPETSTGVGFEFHPATVQIDGELFLVDWRLWSLNRFNCPSSLYCGFDMRVAEGGRGGSRWAWDQRIVVGVSLYDGGSTDVNFEFYLLEDDRPIAMTILVRWGGSNQPEKK